MSPTAFRTYQTRLLRRRVLVRCRTDEALYLHINDEGTDVTWGPREEANDYANNPQLAFERARERGGIVVYLDTEEKITLAEEGA